MNTTTQTEMNDSVREDSAVGHVETPARRFLAAMFLWFAIPASALAQAPSRITYEGFVTHSDDSSVNGPTYLTFSLYDAEIDGTALYQETQLVDVQYGHVSAEIGAVETLDLNLFRYYTELYLDVRVATEDESSPRAHLAVSPYAASAAYADDALTLGGLQPEDMLTGATPLATNVAYDNSGTDLIATTSQEAINALLERIQALESKNDDLESRIAQLRLDLQPQITTNANAIDSLESVTDDHESRLAVIEVQNLDARLSPLEAKTAAMSVSTRGGQPAVVFNGVNVVIQNGAGSTSTTNGTGNLVIGYNALRGNASDVREGSHNLVLGDENSHTSAAYGSLLTGHQNTVEDAYTATIAGRGNETKGPYALVAGGRFNVAYTLATVAGGIFNTAAGHYSTVAGGQHNVASGTRSSVAGGSNNEISDTYACLACGFFNEASGNSASVVGWYSNEAGGCYSSASGGEDR